MPSCGSSARPSVRYVSTRGQASELCFADALLTGLAADGGLYVPEEFPHFVTRRFEGLTELADIGERLL